jgi:hypothetical protein
MRSLGGGNVPRVRGFSVLDNGVVPPLPRVQLNISIIVWALAERKENIKIL